MASEVTEADVLAAEDKMKRAKAAKGTAKSGAKVEAHQAAVQELVDVRSAFRAQEEQAGRRSGFVSGDAAGGQ